MTRRRILLVNGCDLSSALVKALTETVAERRYAVIEIAKSGRGEWPHDIKVLDPVSPDTRVAPKGRHSLPERQQERKNLAMRMKTRK